MFRSRYKLCVFVCVCVCVYGHTNGPAVAQAVSRWVVITKAAFDPRSVHAVLIIDKVVPEQCGPNTLAFLCQYHSTNDPYSS
jgi:hypothetical protein